MGQSARATRAIAVAEVNTGADRRAEYTGCVGREEKDVSLGYGRNGIKLAAAFTPLRRPSLRQARQEGGQHAVTL